MQVLGYTELHEAAFAGDVDKIRELARSISVNCRDDNQATPLHCATTDGRYAAAEALLELGADITAAMWDGSTPLHCAAASGNGELVLLLLEKGADLNAKGYGNMTPLSVATGEAKKVIKEVNKSHKPPRQDIR